MAWKIEIEPDRRQPGLGTVMLIWQEPGCDPFCFTMRTRLSDKGLREAARRAVEARMKRERARAELEAMRDALARYLQEFEAPSTPRQEVHAIDRRAEQRF